VANVAEEVEAKEFFTGKGLVIHPAF